MMDKLHKGEEISIGDINFSFNVNEEKIEIDDKTKFVIDLKHLLDKHIMKEGSCGYNEDVKTGKKFTTPGGLEEVIKSVLDEKKKKRDRCLRIADRKFKKASAYKSGAVVRCRKGNIWKGLKEDQISIQEIVDTLLEKETLRTWFNRSGAKGKEGGWEDCNAPDGKGGYKTCGRKKGEKRAKYPACKPTPSKCKDPGKGKTWGKKAAKLK